MQTCFCDKSTAVKEDYSFCEFEKIILLHVTALHDLFGVEGAFRAIDSRRQWAGVDVWPFQMQGSENVTFVQYSFCSIWETLWHMHRRQ